MSFEAYEVVSDMIPHFETAAKAMYWLSKLPIGYGGTVTITLANDSPDTTGQAHQITMDRAAFDEIRRCYSIGDEAEAAVAKYKPPTTKP